MTTSAEEIRQAFAAHGQGHVFAHWDALNDDERAVLLADCAYVDFDWLEERLRQYKRESTAEIEAVDLEPAPVIRLPQTSDERQREAATRERGEAALREGRLAACVVAGGQGTRLGFDGPKGAYPIGPVSDRSLFQWHAEQILARARRHGVTIPWYVMTSSTNDEATRAYFAEHHFFGFEERDVWFFQQGMVPSIDSEGKLILADKHRIALNPDGHGGVLAALVKSGAVEDMRARGVNTISYFQVDNPLVTICDPVFAGYHLAEGAGFSSKILEKAAPEEKVGHICRSGGKLRVIEYSDMDFEQMHARDENGRLRFWAGSIAIHMLDVEFVGQVGGQARLPWHIARKKIPYFDGKHVVRPDKPNGIKFETFVFDALPLSPSSVTMEVEREQEFAPVKSPAGVDSGDTCRQLLSDRFARWLEACGVAVARDPEGHVKARIEISPLYALDVEELKQKLPSDLQVGEELVLA